MYLAYKSTFKEGNKIRHSSAREYYYCSNYYARKLKFEKAYTKLSRPSSRNNLWLCDKGDMPLVPYIDFETTAPTVPFLNPEDKKNVCSVLCNDFCISSWIKTWESNNWTKLRTIAR